MEDGLKLGWLMRELEMGWVGMDVEGLSMLVLKPMLSGSGVWIPGGLFARHLS